MARVLVVEDEPGIAETIRYALATEGYDVRWCATAGEARVLLRNGADLMVLDVGLPDANGFDFCRELRLTSRLPVIFLTARAGEVDRVAGLELGADDYMVKPFSPRELSARVRAVLRRAAAPPPAGAPGPDPRAHLPFRVDAERRRITYFDRPLELSRHEYRLLEALVARPGRVFTREQLMDLAWDAPEASQDRTVDTHVKLLRAKLRAVKPRIEAIVTHRGTGYALKEDW